MKCGNCGTENAEGFRFCGDCGTPLGQPAIAFSQQQAQLPRAQSYIKPGHVLLFGLQIPAWLFIVSMLCCVVSLLPFFWLRSIIATPSINSVTRIIIAKPSFTIKASSPTPTVTPQAIYKINDSVAIGNWEYKVTKIEKSKTLVWSQYGNKTDAKGIFLIVYMTLKNIGTKNFSINTWDFELQDVGGVKYDTSDASGIYSFIEYKKLVRIGDQFPPGLPLNTALIFDVNPNHQRLGLYLEQAKASVDLGQ